MLFGIERLPAGKKKDALRSKALRLFAAFPCESVPSQAGDHYARIKVTRQQKGLPLDENDLWIAASAAAFEAILVTSDKDFEQIDGPIVQDWSVAAPL